MPGPSEIARRALFGAALVGSAAALGRAAAADDADGKNVDLVPAVTPSLTAFIAGAASAAWPSGILELGKRHILDTLASIIACHDLPPAVLARRYAIAQSGSDTGRGASILGTRQRASLTDAAFANAMTGHSAEINDFSPSAFVQPGPSVVSVSFAIAQTRACSGKAVLQAVIAGYELACRVPKALGTENLRHSGLANHGIGPTFGCGAAAASLLSLPAGRIGDVLSYCSEQASGSWQWLLDTDHIEKAFVFAGMGARNGLQAAMMVEAGFTGVRDNLDRRGGWLDGGVFNGPMSDLNRASLIDKLGTRFELPLVGYKRYPAGGPTQAGVQGLIELVGEVDRQNIERVTIAMPSGDIAAFRDAEIPALNLPFMAALILTDGRLDFAAVQSRARMNDDRIRAAMKKVEMVSDPSQDRLPRVESARTTVTLADGSTREKFVEHVAGFPSAPLSHDDVATKAIELLSPQLGQRRSRAIVDLVWSLETQPNVDELLELLVI